MIRGSDLREAFRLGGVCLVAADAQYSRVEFRGLNRRVIGVFRQWSVTRLAVDLHVAATPLLLQNVRMAAFADLVAGEIHGSGGNLADGISTVVSILSKTLRHQELTHSQKQQAADNENRSQPKEVPCIFEGIHEKAAPLWIQGAWPECGVPDHKKSC
jgi:hypothetical protein